ncbi:hypothetical protein [Microbacterium foliorum]|nr:hypothetical protein [Microbacterium foliorum]
MAAHIAPSTRNGPLHELREETVFDWITRNNSPEKPNTPPVLAMATAAAKKKDPDAGQSVEVQIPEGTN